MGDADISQAWEFCERGLGSSPIPPARGGSNEAGLQLGKTLGNHGNPTVAASTCRISQSCASKPQQRPAERK